MTYISQIEERIQFLQVDESTLLALRQMQHLFEVSIDDLLEDFYAHILQRPELKSLFANQEVVARARSAQKSHWLNTLFSKNLGKAQFDRAEQIGLAHVRVGLTPSWYMGGYCYMLNRFIDLAAQHCQSDPKNLTKIVQALNKSVFLDMSFVIDSYLETKNSVTKEMLQRASRFGKDVQRLNDDFTDTAGDLQASAKPLATSARLFKERAIQVRDALERASLAMHASPQSDAGAQDRADILAQLREASNHIAALVTESELADKNAHEVLECSGRVLGQVEKLNSRLDKARVEDRFSYPSLPQVRSNMRGDVSNAARNLLSRMKTFINRRRS
ncbi:MAG: protoglobin domain-containing protein [Polyangiales bacterium]